MKILAPLSLLLLITTLNAPLEGQDVILLETFEDDTVGGPPGTPDIGSADYLQGTGPKTVTDDFGGKRLRCVDAVTDSGLANQWWPTANSEVFELSYLFRLESATGTGYLTAQAVLLRMDGDSQYLHLYWSSGGEWRLEETSAPGTYSMDTDYQVVWQVDCSTDRVSIFANGTPLFSDFAIGVDCTGLYSCRQGSFFPTTTSEVIDNVKIISGHTLFSDGFESGDTSLWSSTEPL